MLFQNIISHFFFGLVTALCSPVSPANKDVDLTANIVSSTCQIEINNNGVVDLGTVTLDYFSNNITPDTDYAGGKNFTVNVVSCDNLQTTQSQIKFDFQPQTGSLAQANQQVFSNQYELQSIGAKNVGVVIFQHSPMHKNLTFGGRTEHQKPFMPYPLIKRFRQRGHSMPECKKSITLLHLLLAL
ncbi:fimbrial-like protein [Escherichia coli]|nr:fimbrial-like protein [Escherichia coli]